MFLIFICFTKFSFSKVYYEFNNIFNLLSNLLNTIFHFENMIRIYIRALNTCPLYPQITLLYIAFHFSTFQLAWKIADTRILNSNYCHFTPVTTRFYLLTASHVRVCVCVCASFAFSICCKLLFFPLLLHFN